MFEPKRTCNRCRETKYEGDFPFVSGARGRGLYQLRYCGECYAKQKASSPSQIDGSAARNWRGRSRHKSLVCNIRNRARSKALPFDLDGHIDAIGERMYSGKCELSGIDFDFVQAGKPKWNSPSIDRIKPELGYVYTNIRIICHALNTAIGHWGEDQTAALMEAWLEMRKSK